MTQPQTGAQSGADGTQSGAVTGEPASDGTQAGTTTQSGGTDGTGSGDGQQSQTATEPTVPKARHDQILNQLQAADRKRQEAENALQQLRDKDLPEAERAKRELEGLRTENADLKSRLAKSAVTNQFMLDNTHTWHDPKTALALLDQSGLVVSDDYSTVTGMKEALAALAKAHPYLIKTGEATTTNTTAPAAPPMNGQPTGTTNKTKPITQRFPAARSRLGG